MRSVQSLFFFYTSTHHLFLVFFFFNDTATTEIYTLSLHDALPISSTNWSSHRSYSVIPRNPHLYTQYRMDHRRWGMRRSEEHTSELQSRPHLVCRLLLEKKKTNPVRT